MHSAGRATDDVGDAGLGDERFGRGVGSAEEPGEKNHARTIAHDSNKHSPCAQKILPPGAALRVRPKDRLFVLRNLRLHLRLNGLHDPWQIISPPTGRVALTVSRFASYAVTVTPPSRR